MSRLKKQYKEEIQTELQKRFGYKNSMLLPRIEKVVISMGVTEAVKDKGVLQDHLKELALIAGQRPVATKAKTSVSNFKLREGQAIGAMVTLRGKRMYDFIDRFLNIDAPRIRDFRGFKRRADGRGNYSLGLDSQEIFHSLNLDDVKRTQGMNITFVTSTKTTDEECLTILELFGMPFAKKEDK
jgi:large subunit ribosomal protein L5